MLAEFIQAYWQPTLYSILTAVIMSSIKKAKAGVVAFSAKQDLIEEGMLALLHDRLFQACNHVLAEGEITVGELHNLEHLYRNYHNLGGNGVGTELYTRCTQLPIKIVKDTNWE